MSCRSSVIRPDEHGPLNSDNWPRGNPPRRHASTSGTSMGSSDEGSLHSHDGSVVVSVRSSLRARRADSRTATAGCAMDFRSIFARLYDRMAMAIKRRKSLNFLSYLAESTGEASDHGSESATICFHTFQSQTGQSPLRLPTSKDHAPR